MPQWAIIFKIWAEKPVYHKLAIASHDMTVCGRRLGMYKPLLPMKHALKFGKPCRGCFPAAGPK